MGFGKVMRARARRMRRFLTRSEQKTYKILKELNVGVKLQVTCGGYIADFVGTDRNFVLEIDGISHLSQKAYDNKRDCFFRAAGFNVIRILNGNVNKENIELAIKDCEVYRTKHEVHNRLWYAGVLKNAAQREKRKVTKRKERNRSIYYI